MAEALIELVPGADGLAVSLRLADSDTALARAQVPQALLETGDPTLPGPDGQSLTVAALAPGRVPGLLPGGAMQIGRYLHALALPEPVGAAWRTLRADRQAAGTGLTTLLTLAAAGPAPVAGFSLTALPWELLYDGALFLFRDQRHPLGLHRPDAPPPLPARPRWPLRMLLLVGTTDAGIAWQEELLAIERALAAFSLRVDLTVQQAPLTIAGAEEVLRKIRPHLLHFVGHGRAPPGGDGELWLHDGQDEVPWQRADLHAALTALDPPPRIVVLNACDSAAGDGTAAVAEAFADLGCPAVIAMRGEIPGRAAAVFSAAFYGALADSGIDRPDLAYARALQAVAGEPVNGSRSWSLPRLFLQRGVADVFPQLGDGRGFRHSAAAFADLLPLKPFVDRAAERAALYHDSDGWLSQSPPASRVLLVQGEGQVGKSWFLKGLVYVAHLRGLRTFYWDFADPPPDAEPGARVHYELEDVLRALRQGKPWPGVFFARPPWAAAIPDPFAAFDAVLAAGGEAPRGNEDARSSKVQAFASGLAEVARAGPLLIALDHLPNINPGAWTSWLYKELLLPVARGQLGGDIRLMIAGTDAELATYQLTSLTPPPAGTRLLPLPGKHCADLLFRYLLHFLEPGQEDRLTRFRTLADLVAADNGNQDWRPGKFAVAGRLLNLLPGAGP